jgi:hypothetical protein
MGGVQFRQHFLANFWCLQKVAIYNKAKILLEVTDLNINLSLTKTLCSFFLDEKRTKKIKARQKFTCLQLRDPQAKFLEKNIFLTEFLLRIQILYYILFR